MHENNNRKILTESHSMVSYFNVLLLFCVYLGPSLARFLLFGDLCFIFPFAVSPRCFFVSLSSFFTSFRQFGKRFKYTYFAFPIGLQICLLGASKAIIAIMSSIYQKLCPTTATERERMVNSNYFNWKYFFSSGECIAAIATAQSERERVAHPELSKCRNDSTAVMGVFITPI